MSDNCRIAESIPEPTKCIACSWASDRISERPTAEDVLSFYKEAYWQFEDFAPNEVNREAADADFPIHMACGRGRMEEVVALLEAGADVNAAGDMSERPLHIAARRGNVELAELLVKYGADVSLRSDFGDTAQEQARRGCDLCGYRSKGHHAVEEFLLKYKAE